MRSATMSSCNGSPSFGLVKCGADAIDHAAHGNWGKAAETAAVGIVTDGLSGGLGTVADVVGGAKDAYDCYKTGTSTEYQGRGRPRNSDYNHNGYFK